MNKENKQKQNGNSLMNLIERIKSDKVVATYTVCAIIAIIAIIVIICISIAGGKSDKEDKPQEEAQETTVSGQDVAAAETTFVDDGSLQENAYDAVNKIIGDYFLAMASGDVNAVAALKSDTTEEELIRVEKKSAYIESFENITVYTKLGNVPDSYIAFVHYDINFAGVDTFAPGLTTLYVCASEDGSLHIYDGDLDEATSERIKEAAAEDDVVDLFNRVEVAYNEAIESDPNLKTFMDELPTKLGTEVATALAEKEAEKAAAEAAANEAAEAANVEQPEAAETANAAETVEANDTVNVRSSDSENADKLGKLDIGTRVTRYEARENGWSRIDFNGQEGYVKSEFLTAVSTDAPADTNTEQVQDTSSTQSQGTVGIKETANVRKSAGEGAEKIGVAYQGEHYELLMKQADGWSKIQFGNQVGFIKSEFLEFE